ncbi:MAG: winged helix-turn-helix domain-containing protein, partial [Rhizobacter sp.]
MTTFGSPAALYRFGTFELQPAERRLLDEGVAAAITPRAFDVLLLLVERSGSLVSKEDLFSRVWPKVVVDDSALQVQISALRKILGFDAIATVSGRGYRFVMPLANGDTASDGAGHPPRHNLPLTSSTFIGRDGDIARLRQALARARLVTLTGAGGCGKTRLAMRVASAQLGRHPDGVWMVELAALADAALVPQAVLRTLAVPESAGSAPLATLCAHLASQRLLLLLDNAEHLLPGVATLADALLRECPGVTLLVTSREKLDLPGESTYRVPSLTLPEVGERQSPDQLMEAESVCLFVDRTRLVRPHFAVTSENAAALA